jgi:hypothetical protein
MLILREGGDWSGEGGCAVCGVLWEKPRSARHTGLWVLAYGGDAIAGSYSPPAATSSIRQHCIEARLLNGLADQILHCGHERLSRLVARGFAIKTRSEGIGFGHC